MASPIKLDDFQRFINYHQNNNFQSILHETLLKIKNRKGNKIVLKPIEKSTLMRFKRDMTSLKKGEEIKEESAAAEDIEEIDLFNDSSNHILDLDELTQEDQFFLF